ncbi:hypothetical protein 035JT004_288 [Bacillus phage 035JT004]|nr:hypothetical protein 035JT004_18 [Bacillus phage 035JT004]QZA69776.1 hypothetical protein 035JT004_288 [Bacillus phage 035JT004]
MKRGEIQLNGTVLYINDTVITFPSDQAAREFLMDLVSREVLD